MILLELGAAAASRTHRVGDLRSGDVGTSAAGAGKIDGANLGRERINSGGGKDKSSQPHNLIWTVID